MKTARLLEQIVENWGQVRPGLDAVTMRRCILLKRTSDSVADGIERLQRQHGLNHALADLLLTLYRSAPPQGLTAGELTELAAITPGSMTHRIDRVVEEGLVERTVDKHDARARRVRLTAAGRRRVEELLPLHVANETRLLAGLSETELAELERLLLKLVGHIEGLEDARGGGTMVEKKDP